MQKPQWTKIERRSKRFQPGSWTKYHSPGNQFERFRGVLELIGRFEFEFRRRGSYFCERFEFLVCSKFNHTQCGRTCARAVACLPPHNSISNVVVSLTIHDIYIYIYMYIFERDVAKNMKPLWKAKGSFNRTS